MGTKGACAGPCLPCRAALGWGVAGCRTHARQGHASGAARSGCALPGRQRMSQLPFS